MTGAIWINVKTKRVYKMKKNEIFSKTEICSIFDNIISQNISFYFKISLVVNTFIESVSYTVLTHQATK